MLLVRAAAAAARRRGCWRIGITADARRWVISRINGEDHAALGVLRRLAVFDVSPFTCDLPMGTLRYISISVTLVRGTGRPHRCGLCLPITAYSSPLTVVAIASSWLGRVGKAQHVCHQTRGRGGFRKAMTSRIFVSAGQQHAQTVRPNARPAWEGCRISARPAGSQISRAARPLIPRMSNTVACISLLWIRTEPPPTS